MNKKERFFMELPKEQQMEINTGENEEKKHRFFERWMFVLLVATVAVSAVFAFLGFGEHSSYADKMAQLQQLTNKAEELNNEAARIEGIINGDSDEDDHYVYEMLIDDGYGQNGEQWFINEEYGN